MPLTRLPLTTGVSGTLAAGNGGTGVTSADEIGNLVKISSVTASGNSSIEFTSGLDSTYRKYVFEFSGISSDTNASGLQFDFSNDGGSTYAVLKTTNQFEAYHTESNSTSNLRYDANNRDLSQSAADQMIGVPMGANSGEEDSSLSGCLEVYDVASTSLVKQFMCRSTAAGDGTSLYAWTLFTNGYGNTTSAIDAIKFSMTAGNIDDGTITMYGVKA